MAHFPKPFYRAYRSSWYVQLGGIQKNLGPEKVEAFRRYHALMAEPPADTPAVSAKDKAR